jgi:hypothetical protein
MPIFPLNLTPAEKQSLSLIARDAGYPTVSGYVRSLIAAASGNPTWEAGAHKVAYVVMSHDETRFLSDKGGVVNKRGNARKFASMNAANEARLGLPDADGWRVGIIRVQTKPNKEK